MRLSSLLVLVSVSRRLLRKFLRLSSFIEPSQIVLKDPKVDLVPHEQLQSLQANSSFKGIYLPVHFVLHGYSFLQVYFTWVIRDFGTAEWFHSLLHAIEEQDTQNRIEINIYLTAKIKEDDMNNIIVHDVGAEKDAITSLRAPTHFGRPNWDRVFSSIVDKHPETDVGVVCLQPLLLLLCFV